MKVLIHSSALVVDPALAGVLSGHLPSGWSVEVSDDPVALLLPTNGEAAIVIGPDTLAVPAGVAFLPVTAVQGQWELLWKLAAYPGLMALLSTAGWTAQDHARAIMERHDAAIARLREGRVAAVFGAQRLGVEVCEGLAKFGVAVSVVLDNNAAKWGTAVNGIRVDRLESVEDKRLPIVIGTTKHSHGIAAQLRAAGYVNVLPYPVLSLLDADIFPHEIPYRGIQHDLAENLSEYLRLYFTVADDRSRQVLDGLVHYRLTYDTRCIEPIADSEDIHYFCPDLIRLGPDEVFVDAGAFDGDTALRFVKAAGNRYRAIFLFEPEAKLMERAKANLSEMHDVTFIPAGAYSTDGRLWFSATGTVNGSFNGEGDIEIPVRRIDAVIPVLPTMIKMDIEGAETDALLGAKETIGRSHPKLAIAVYHKSPDLWALPKLIRDLDASYRLFLRHYSSTGLETVAYAL